MGNRTPLGRDQDREARDSIAEAGLFYVGEQKHISARRARLEKIMGGLQEADDIELERAKKRVIRAKQELYEAAADLERCEEIHSQKAEIRSEMLALDDEDRRTTEEAEHAIAVSGDAAGVPYIRTELLRPKGMVARRRQLRQTQEISTAEADAL